MLFFFFQISKILNILRSIKRGQIVGAHMVGACVTKTTQTNGFSRNTVSKVMIASEKEKKTASAKHKSGWKSKLSEIFTLNC